MYNGGKIVSGLVIFAVLLTFPIWYNGITGKATYVPDPQIPTTETQCIESAQYMKDNHMKLLDEWRTDVVRNNEHIYTASDGQTYEISLENTCLDCHSDKKEFCDQCHQYVGISPNCWDCHNIPSTP
jgi:hypothetical protein